MSMGRVVLQFELLRLIEQGSGEWSWHDLAMQLSNKNVPRQLDMLAVLKGMARTGLVHRTVEPGSPVDKWMLTGHGDRLLAGLRNGKTGQGERTIIVSRAGLLAVPKVKSSLSAVGRTKKAEPPRLRVFSGRTVGDVQKRLWSIAWQNKVSAKAFSATDLRL